MHKHRNLRQRLPKPRSPDNFGTLDDLFALLKDNLGKADAFITSAEYQMEQAPSGNPEEDQCCRSHVEHLIEAAKFCGTGGGLHGRRDRPHEGRMSDVATELDALRIAVGETEALAAVTAEAYDRQDRDDALHDERMASLLGLISKSATGALAAFHRLHGAVADAQPAPAGEAFDYSDGTAPGAG
jgi:hypothetical protein